MQAFPFALSLVASTGLCKATLPAHARPDTMACIASNTESVAQGAALMKRKRPVDDEAPPPVETPTVGQLTSHIGNKQVRSEAYGRLKAAKKVRPFLTYPTWLYVGLLHRV